MHNEQDIIAYLSDTDAFVVAPTERPFWYTSGLFGPYYINTHFLYGSKAAAVRLLDQIEAACRPENRAGIARRIAAETERQYESNAIFRRVIDDLTALAGTSGCDYVSGGERRDFFFSIEVARRLDRPHLYIFKDGDVRLAADPAADATRPGNLSGRVLHVADLITKASSYERAWLPALQAHGLEMTMTVAGVDRAQGGRAVLAAHGVTAAALTSIDSGLFAAMRRLGRIDAAQEAQLNAYAADEMEFVRAFLRDHPGFLHEEAARDAKTKERVERLRERLRTETA